MTVETTTKMSIREWLCTQIDDTTGLPLARPGKGRFSRAAQAAVAAAYASGMTFTDDDPKPEKAPREKKVKAEIAPRVKAPERDFDYNHVRKWAAENGIAVGERGRVKAEILVKYDAANPVKSKTVTGVATSAGVSLSKAVVKPEKDRVRPENVAYALAKAPEGHGYVQRVSVAFEKCGGCKWAIGYCSCEGGPRVPSYLDGVKGDRASLSAL